MRDDRLLEPSYGRGDAGAAILRGQVMGSGFGAGLVASMTRRLGKPTSLTASQRRVTTTLSHAGFVGLDKLVMFRLAQLGAVVMGDLAGAALGSKMGNLALQMTLFFGAMGYFLPIGILRRMARNRQARIIQELPATLDLLTVCLEAGQAWPRRSAWWPAVRSYAAACSVPTSLI